MKITSAVLLRALVLVAAGVAIYFPALRGEWLWDDGTLILQNHVIHDPDGLATIWHGPINGTEFLPLTSSVEWVEWHFFGADTLGYHLVSLALHIAGALLVWRLLAKLGLRHAWLGGLLFAIHPVAVESVAWISELKNTLSLPPLLLAMIAWVDYDRDGRRRDYYFALGWFLVAMLAKPTGLMLPAILLLHAWWKHGRISSRELLAAAPFLVIAAALGWLASALATAHVEPSPVAGAWARLATAGWQMLALLGKCLVPAHLLPLYPSGLIATPSLLDLVPWALILLVLLAAWHWRAIGGRAVLLGLGFFLLNFVPVFGFIYANATAMTWSLDHLVYLPLVGIVGLAAAGLDLAQAKATVPARSLIFAATALVCVIFAVGSFRYAGVFANPGTLWTYDLTGNPGSATAHNNLAHFYLNHGRYAQAAEQYRAALQIQPGYAYAHNGLGNALAMQGHTLEAAAEYRSAIAADPAYAEAHNGLANALRAMNLLDEARREADLSLKLKPGYVDAMCTLGLIDAQQGKIAEAIARFEAAQILAPGDARIGKELDNLRGQK